ncbi:LOW QUALITY PROTEIN: hypothetical protein BC938DRAFT_480537 [Jimgerdemannia flammicorona]|uniref:CCHC-type domain-containing protein n=1 Tax=Jimgerdemannia flammicorona TaxID=994334 RepID=A0A433QIB5_9FUNG|nr:LOW QUALITY PROTEIN: hypothetical protein BC938DRAFT_480537 [Jimgerdemannia flammicorona]
MIYTTYPSTAGGGEESDSVDQLTFTEEGILTTTEYILYSHGFQKKFKISIPINFDEDEDGDEEETPVQNRRRKRMIVESDEDEDNTEVIEITEMDEMDETVEPRRNEGEKPVSCIICGRIGHDSSECGEQFYLDEQEPLTNPTKNSESVAQVSLEDIRKMGRDKFKDYLRGKFSKEDIDDDDLEMLWTEKIGGRAFLMKEESAFEHCGLKFGPATILLKHVKELNKRKLAEEGIPPPKRLKTVNIHGPVEVQKHFIVPFERLASYNKLLDAIQEKKCPLLVGHFQSGKTSTLKHLSQQGSNWIYFSSSTLSEQRQGLLDDICKALSVGRCDHLKQLNDNLPVILLFDEFDSYLLHPNVADINGSLRLLQELVKSVSDQELNMIQSVVCAGSFALSQLTNMLSSTAPVTMESNSQSLDFVAVPSPWNASDVIEASDFTIENHWRFFPRSKAVWDGVLMEVRTRGHAGFEGLFAAKCIEWTANTEGHVLTLESYTPRITDFIRARTMEKLEVVTHIRSRLNSKDGNAIPLRTAAKTLLERFLHVGSLTKFDIKDDESEALIYLRGLGIIKETEDFKEYIFTSNLLFDLLSDEYYPIGDGGGVERFGNIGDADDFFQKVVQLFQHIRRTIYDPLAVNAHSVAEAMIQGELYALMRMAMPYPRYRVYRETRTIKGSEKKYDLWTTNGSEYGIECKVNLATEAEIMKNAKQAVRYARNRVNARAMFLLNFVPAESLSDAPSLYYAIGSGLSHFEVVHVLYHSENKYATVHRLDYNTVRVPFAME